MIRLPSSTCAKYVVEIMAWQVARPQRISRQFCRRLITIGWSGYNLTGISQAILIEPSPYFRGWSSFRSLSRQWLQGCLSGKLGSSDSPPRLQTVDSWWGSYGLDWLRAKTGVMGFIVTHFEFCNEGHELSKHQETGITPNSAAIFVRLG